MFKKDLKATKNLKIKIGYKFDKNKKIRINKKSNTYFIGTENFVAITKYNYSHFYAMVVYNLARELGL